MLNRTSLVWGINAGIAAAVFVGSMGAVAAYAHADVPPATVVTEDSPLWDCRTMGNQVCGPGAVLPDGTIAVPGQYDDGILIPWTAPVIPEWCKDVCLGA